MRDTSPPLRCADARPYLSAYADDELADALREQVARHVADCEVCNREVLRFHAMDRLVGSLPSSYPSPVVLDRVLSAVSRRPVEQVTRESLRRPGRRLIQVGLPSFLVLRDTPTFAPLPRRSRVLAGALAALAAMLVISFAVFAIQRLPPGHFGRTGNLINTPAPQGTALDQTRQKLDTLAPQLDFIPALPTYLPAGARLQNITVGPPTASKNSRVLDILWAVPAQHFTVYLREAPESLGVRNDWADGTISPILSWQLPKLAPWRLGTLQDRPGDWTIGQDSGGFSVTVGINGASTSVQYGRFVGTVPTDAEVSTLRLVSLSMNLPYRPLTIQPPDFSSEVVHYVAWSMNGPARITWDVYFDPAHNWTWTDVVSGTTHYTDISDGTRVLRLDWTRHTYASISVSQAGDPGALQPQARAFFLDADTAEAHGALWNIGEKTWQNQRVVALYLVTAPYPTYLYVDPVSVQTVGASVEYGSVDHPGSSQATSQLSPLDGCPDLSYTTIMLLPAAPTGRFAMTTNGFSPGAPAPTVSC